MKSERNRGGHRDVVLGGGGGAHRTPPAPFAELRRELNRSRRYGHELALLWLGPRADEAVATDDLLTTVERLTREIDCSWVAVGRLLVVLPESNRTGAEKLVGRLSAAEPDLLARLEARIAVFPEDGLTSGALLDAVAGPRATFDAFDHSRRVLDDAPALVGRLLRLTRVSGQVPGLPSETGS